MLRRQQLCFIQNHDRIDDVMQLAAAGRFGGVKGFEELNVGGDYHGRIPVLRSQTALRRFVLRFEVAVMFDDRRWLDAGEDAAKNVRRLLDDAGVGNDIDDTFQVVPLSMSESETERSECLASAGRNGKTEEPWRFTSVGKTCGANLVPQRLDRRVYN